MKGLKFLTIIILLTSALAFCQNKPLVPHHGEWWQIAGDPDLGTYTSEKQQPVDFGIWQAKDGTWQLWSCIRHTLCGGNTRLFYRWEGQSLTDTNWKPMGIAMQADTTLGETKGGLQAPFVIREGDDFWMFYGSWANICLAHSTDGVTFERVINESGTPIIFTGPYMNTRDPMVIKINGLYYCYYMGHSQELEPHSAIFCRTSADLKDWSQPVMVSGGGTPASQSDWYGGDAECPFVVHKDGFFYLFRNQVYGENNLNTQYRSQDPLNFGVNNDRYLIGTMQVAAPEIIHHNDEYYIASLLPGLKGIRMAKLSWEEPR